MVNSGRKLFLQAASVLMAIIMLMFQFVQFPPAVTAASTTDIYVGYSGKSNNYNTVTEALAACQSINPSSESERITVHIAPGTYREQLVIKTPYITFVNDETYITGANNVLIKETKE